jgi:hypothetical protein
MKTELAFPWARQLRWQLALMVFVVVSCCGGLGSWFVVQQMQDRAAGAVMADAQAFASAVARTLAGQFEKAVTHGAPLEQIPRVEAYLEKLQRSTPGVNRIALKGDKGQVLSAVQGNAAKLAAEGAAFISVEGRVVGAVQVEVAIEKFADPHASVAWLLFALVFAIAALCAAWVSVGLGGSASRAQGILIGRLADSSVLTSLSEEAFAAKPKEDPIQRALHELVEGESRLQDRLTEFENLAQEMLAVDFDDQLAPRIEAIRAKAVRSIKQGDA